jgi:hypothetical protein
MNKQTESSEPQARYSLDGFLETGFMFDVKSAYAYFEREKDKRKARGLQYPIPAVLTAASWAEILLRLTSRWNRVSIISAASRWLAPMRPVK